MRIDFYNPGTVGLIKDIPDSLIPVEGWTDARNVRFRNGAIEQYEGEVTVAETVSGGAYFVISVPEISDIDDLVVYTNLNKAYAFDGVSSTEITRASGLYSATANNTWNGGILGGVLILNNGTDLPQQWVYPPNKATLLTDLSNWSTSWTTAVMRPFREYLVALDVTKGDTRFPTMVKWSQPADPGSVPDSWDETDPTKQAGEFNLLAGGREIVDGAAFRDQFLIYKSQSTWAMRFVGGLPVFSFQEVFPSHGLLSRNAWVAIGERHFVVTQHVIGVHNGVQFDESITPHKVRDWFYKTLDPDNARKTFCLHNSRMNEVWACFCRNNTTPDTALVWNYHENVWTIRDVPDIQAGVLTRYSLTLPSTIWNDENRVWSAVSDVWNDSLAEHRDQRLFIASPDNNHLFVADSTFQFGGVNFNSNVERTSIGVFGQDRYGNPKIKFDQIKEVKAVWPVVEKDGNNAASFEIHVGSQMRKGEDITWNGPFTFDPDTDIKINCRVVGRYISLRFGSTENAGWKLHGFTLDVDPAGRF